MAMKMQIFCNLANFPRRIVVEKPAPPQKRKKKKKKGDGSKGDETRDVVMNGKQSRVVCGCLLRNMLYGWGARC
jgi:hypothetical protein